ncbi:uncharacterized protein Fhos isoform X2 [Diachasmimorpha longicaudata]|uniref:uncharacterized protein Fhos isoform X2 n=1 Tax=Diachasmimorpha longicaudata TaxID=58733 RepID=UPI0030B89547
MSSYKSYNDSSGYRPRSGASVGVTLARNPVSGSTSLPNYRTSYSSNLTSTSRGLGTGKDRINGVVSSGYGNAALNKRDIKSHDQTYNKYSAQKSDKNRLNPGRTSLEDVRKSPIPEKTLFEKYSYPTKTADRPSSVLDKYNRSIASRDKPREQEITQRYIVNTYPGSGARCNYDVGPAEKKERTENSSYKSVRATGGTCRSSREPSPEVATKSFRVYPRVSNYGRSGSSTETTPIASRYPSSSRYTPSISRAGERTATPVGYSNSERLRSPSVKIPSNFKEDCKALPSASCEIATEKSRKIENSTVTENPEVTIPEENDNLPPQETKVESVITLTVISRGTSPGPPASSSFVRNRRAEAARLIQKEITKLKRKSETKDAEIQSDKIDDCSTRYSRFASGRVWPSYLDKFPTSGSYSRNYGPRISGFTYEQQSGDSRDKSARGEAQEKQFIQEDNNGKKYEGTLIPSRSFGQKIQNFGYHNGAASTEDPVDVCSQLTSSSTQGLSRQDSNNEISPKPEVSPTGQNEREKEGKKPNNPRKYCRSLSQKFSSFNDDTNNHKEPENLTGEESKGDKQLKRRGGSVSSTASSEGVAKSISRNSSTKSLNQQRQMTRTDSSDSSVSLPTGKCKSSNAPSHQAKIKGNGSQSSSVSSGRVNSNRTSGSEARGKPPVPKICEVNANMKISPATKYVNKDFRKSALNMPDASEAMRLQYERKRGKKMQRSVSISSQDSESNNSERKNCSIARSDSKSTSLPRFSGLQTSRSGSKMRRKHSSSESSDSSSESSSTEDDEGSASKRIRCKRISNSPKMERKRTISGDFSRTSALASSADELSFNMEKPPRPSPSPRSRSEKSLKSEEAKSFLIRTLTPVTNFFKNKEDSEGNLEENSEGMRISRSPSVNKSISSSLGNSRSFSHEKSCERTGQGTLRHQSSGEKPWWMDSNSENVPEGVERMSVCQDEISQETTVSTNLPDDGKFKTRIWRQDSGERPWWFDTDEVKKVTSASSPVARKNSSRTSSERRNRLKHQQSGERAWWLSEDPTDVPEGIEVYPPVAIVSPISVSKSSGDNSVSLVEDETHTRSHHRISHVESGERAWWMDSNSNIPDGIQKITPDRETNSNSDDSDESLEKFDILQSHSVDTQSRSISTFPLQFPPPPNEPLGDRASPEGIENPPEPPNCYEGRGSPYDNVQSLGRSTPRKSYRKRPSTLPLFIGNHTNIDDLLGQVTPRQSPIMSRIRKQEMMEDDLDDSSECEEIDADQVIIHDSTPQTPVIQRRGRDTERPQPDGYIPLDDTALQLYKDGDYGAYLDLEASISEQQEEFEGFQTNRKNSIVLRTQLSVRVHTIIEKLLNSEGRELRRALFSLKQIFQEDKDLVHEFVQNDGLACLIKVGNEADQNYQNYILRALGQVMLYVDGMNGVMEHGQTVQWLYTLIASRFRLVVKTALKLLLVFVEYVETNSLLLVRAVRSVDTSRGMIPWTNVMKLLKDYDAADTELLIYATTLVNKCLNGIPDQDTYYDQVDCLEEQGIEGIIQRYMSKQGTDLDLLRQFQIYEAVLHHEDGNDRGSPIRQLDDNIRKTLRNRKSLVDSQERRKSRRHSTGTSPLSMSLNARLSPRLNHSLGLNSLNGTLNSSLLDDDDESSSSQSSQGLGDVQLNGSYKENKGGYPNDVGVTPALRRRRERAERQRSFIREQQEATANMRATIGNAEDQEGPFVSNGSRYTNGTTYERNDSSSNKISRANSRKDLTPLMNVANKLDSEEKKPWYGKSPDEGVECDEGNHTDEDEDRRVLVQMKRDGTVKDLTQKLTAQNLIPSSPVEDKVSRIGDMSGLISKAKEGLAKSKSKADIVKSPTGDSIPKLPEIKKSENELHWEELVNQLKRPLALCDLDFTDLNSDDEIDVLGPVNVTNGVPPPPPPMISSQNGTKASAAPPPPPPGGRFPPPFPNGPPPLFGVNLKSSRSCPITESPGTIKTPPPPTISKKSKKTVKLFWKEVRDDPIILSRLDKNKMIWDELQPVPVDTQKLEHLFESRAKDLITKEKQQEMNKNKEIIVLDHKRSNAINIGMTKLPPPRSIKTAILKMDATIMNREGIEKLLTMLPTEEERSRIQEAQAASPDLPLGSAEQFLLTLASISELPARLKLWAFKLDFENSEKEIADPLMDLKQGMETLRVNKTFRGILSTLLSIGIFLNGNEVKGFQLEYLAKVPEVKDTVHKHSLLHHLCHMVMEKFPDSTDLYSEIGAVTRASKIDFDELASNISKLESECKASWDHLKLIAKHDGSTMMKVKMSDFLADCAERIIVLSIVHRRIINRFHKFILWLGIPLHRVQDTKPNEFCRIVSEFALEYRTTRERVIQQLEKKANHRERNKTRGKMITEVGKFRTKEDRADAELRQLLGSDISDVESLHGTLPWRRQRKDGRTALGPILRDESTNGNVTDGDDELLESLVKTATKSPATRTTPRERKRTRHADLRRTLKNGLSEEEKKHIAAYIKGY